ncbi:MAG: SIS domain-containing protein [Acidimicrobiia bacterium]|nr:SIS domain-containing protein [Acidimicrobiia bacterium]
MTMLSEIAEQPEVVASVVDANQQKMERVEQLAADCTHVVIAARGTSDNAARYAQYVWGAQNRLSVGLTTPSLFGPLASPPSLADALVVGISQSGQSPDLVEVLAEAGRQGRPTLAITNDVNSPMADTAEIVIDLCAREERAIAATKTYTSQLTAVALLSLAFSGGAPGKLDVLPDAIARTTGTDMIDAVSGLIDVDRCVVVGRGFHQATIYEWALKLQELTYLLSQPFSAADFRHGPVAVVEEGFPVLAVATAGPTLDEMTTLVTDMQTRNAHVVTMTDSDAPGDVIISIPEVEPWLSPIVAAPALQRFAHDLTVARGIDPETPRGLSKVTHTR